jgi:hypothetical protein
VQDPPCFSVDKQDTGGRFLEEFVQIRKGSIFVK